LLGPDAPALCLRHDAEHDGDIEAALTEPEQAYASAFPQAPEIKVVLLQEPIPREELARLGLAVDAALEPLADRDNVRRAWLFGTGARFLDDVG